MLIILSFVFLHASAITFLFKTIWIFFCLFYSFIPCLFEYLGQSVIPDHYLFLLHFLFIYIYI